MKKFLSMSIAFLLCISLAACQSNQQISNVPSSSGPADTSSKSSTVDSSVPASSTSPSSKGSSSTGEITDAESVAKALKAKELPIDNIIVYTDETDTNELLGRPNQYTSKVNFADTRAEQTDKDDPVGGSVEVFDNQADAKTRYDYVDNIVKNGGSMFAQYLYLNGNVFLRIDGTLTPEQAKEYQTAFGKIMK